MLKTSTTNAPGEIAEAISLLQFGPMGQYLVNVLPLGLVVFDRHLNITSCNPRARELLYSESNIAVALEKGSPPDADTEWQRKLCQVLDDNEPCTFENVSYSKDDILSVLRIICSPICQQDNHEVIGGILHIEDVTAKVVMEKNLAASERLAAIGKLAARVAHELNNPLDGIMRYLSLAMRVAENLPSDSIMRYLQESHKGLQRMVRIVGELLQFSRSTYSACEATDINHIIDDALQTMQPQIDRSRVTIQRNYTKDLPHIPGGNLFQVFCNLIKNAVDAMPEGGTLTVTTTSNDRNLILEFADTGTGLTEEVRQKLFDPFFTTKEVGKGTGLGLAICKDIVERCSGQIRAENRPEGGTRFILQIPVHNPRQIQKQTA